MVVPPAQKMRILSWNILHGEQIPPAGKLTAEQWKNNLITSATEISQNLKPDFIGLQEVDLNQNRSGNLNQTEVIAETIGLKYWAYIPTLIGTPGERWQKVDLRNSPLLTNASPNKQVRDLLPPSYGIGFATNQPIKKIYFKYLGRSLVGMPLLIPNENKSGARFIYVQDEPRVALIAELENGLTITTTHLSFAPGVNMYQLKKLSNFLNTIAGKHILSGDLNLPANLPTKLSAITGGWNSLVDQSTYPSWKPKIQFDYLLAKRESDLSANQLSTIRPVISDHIPIGAEIFFN